jgi:anti-sigma factor RsiW
MLCSRVQNQLSAYFDRELTGEEMLALRRHLRDCAACRREHDGLLQVKSLFGALRAVEPRRPFDSALLDAPAPSSRRPHPALESLTRAGEWARGYVLSPAQMTLGGAFAVVLLAGALVYQPQPADAVSAHVPEFPTEESAPVYFAPTVVVRPLPGEPVVAPGTLPNARGGYLPLSPRQPDRVMLTEYRGEWRAH